MEIIESLRAKKELLYQKMEIVRRQIIMNGEFINLKNLENEILTSDFKSIQNEIQLLSEKIDYDFVYPNI